MDDAELMRLMERTRELNEDPIDAGELKRPLSIDERAEIFALDIFHHDEELTALKLSEIEKLNRIRMIELRNDLALSEEAADDLRIPRELSPQRFDRHAPRRRSEALLCEVDPPHPALADALDDCIAIEERLADQAIGLLSEARATADAEFRSFFVRMGAALTGDLHGLWMSCGAAPKTRVRVPERDGDPYTRPRLILDAKRRRSFQIQAPSLGE